MKIESKIGGTLVITPNTGDARNNIRLGNGTATYVVNGQTVQRHLLSKGNDQHTVYDLGVLCCDWNRCRQAVAARGRQLV